MNENVEFTRGLETGKKLADHRRSIGRSIGFLAFNACATTSAVLLAYRDKNPLWLGPASINGVASIMYAKHILHNVDELIGQATPSQLAELSPPVIEELG